MCVVCVVCVDIPGCGGLLSEQKQKQPLMEDVLLRGFAPFQEHSQKQLDFGMDSLLTPVSEV